MTLSKIITDIKELHSGEEEENRRYNNRKPTKGKKEVIKMEALATLALVTIVIYVSKL
jgi:cell division protein FtsB